MMKGDQLWDPICCYGFGYGTTTNNTEVRLNVIEDKSQVVSDSRYVMNNCDEALAPYILLEGKSNEGTFTFVYSLAGSYVAFGKLILNDNSGNTYTFIVDGSIFSLTEK